MRSAFFQSYVSGFRASVTWSSIALAASIPVSTALDNVLLSVIVLAWVIGADYKAKSVLFKNKVFQAALLLFGVLIVGSLYGRAAPGDTGLFLKKYMDLALIPVIAWPFLTPSYRARALQLFAAALAVILLISCALKSGLLPPQPWLRATPESPLVFKLRITHNILMAFAAFLYAWLCRTSITKFAKLVWGGLSVLAAANVLMMVEGATGYLVLFSLTVLFAWQRLGLKGISLAAAASFAIVAILSLVPGPFQSRVNQIVYEVRQTSPDNLAASSAGQRFEYYRNTLAIIAKNPVFGMGTGGFPAAYAELVRGSGANPTSNPHNQFLLITAQTGLFGLGALLWLLWQQWRYAPQLPTLMERGLAQGLVITIAVICLLNSALLDHTEGLFYAWMTALLYAGIKSSVQPPAQVV